MKKKFPGEKEILMPLPHDETEAFRRYSLRFPIAVIVASTAICIMVSMVYFERPPGELLWVLEWLPWAEKRYEFLASDGAKSQVSYLVTVLCSVYIIPAAVLIDLVVYWRTVVAQRRCKGVNVYTFLRLLIGASGFFVIWFVLVFWTPAFFESEYPGMKVFLFWPAFSLLNGLCNMLFAVFVFGTLVSVTKFIFLREGHPSIE